MQIAPVQRTSVRRENDRAPSPNAGPQFPLSAVYPDEGRAAQISNRNTIEFRISPNSNKPQRILISNRNINPDVASSFSSQIRVTLTKEGPRLTLTSAGPHRRFTLTNAAPHSPANSFLITDPRLETTPKHQKTKARDDF
jgi:hypothetical protein